jgi:glyoxalase family protein
VHVDEQPSPFGEPSLRCDDPSGLVFTLVEGDDDRKPWVSDAVSQPVAIRGLHSVTMTVASRGPSIGFLRDVLGFEAVNENANCTRMVIAGDRAGRRIDVLEAPDGPRAVNGLGTVHHVAMAVASAEDQLNMRHELMRRNCQSRSP